ncbi:putative alcohol dehydrogenase [Thozetella sp. PMI_491]|nr:putative alcohol dehydrogenase [Thozetella sp. PMI_491]
MAEIPKSTKQWNVVGYEGLDSLKYTEQPVPELGDNQVLVKLYAASLNYRDIVIANGTYPFALKPNVVPGSDGAGTVLAVGKHVTRFQPGDNVTTIINPYRVGGAVDEKHAEFGLGGTADGTLRSIGAFDEQALVAMPKGLSFLEASTLGCAGVTAWNALFGLPGKHVTAGHYVLTQGTGGVSIFALQFAKAVGATVIATTSSEEKVQFLKTLGADHVINYRDNPNWGDTAKKLAGGVGVDLVVEVAGPTTLQQSVNSLRLDGVITVVGFVAGIPEGAQMPSLLDAWRRCFLARGIWQGTRPQMEEMCRAIEGNTERLRPIVAQKVFTLDQLKEAFTYLSEGKHQGKVCIKIE